MFKLLLPGAPARLTATGGHRSLALVGGQPIGRGGHIRLGVQLGSAKPHRRATGRTVLRTRGAAPPLHGSCNIRHRLARRDWARGAVMETLYDWITIAVFGALVVLF